jgi:hypothetical protein
MPEYAMAFRISPAAICDTKAAVCAMDVNSAIAWVLHIYPDAHSIREINDHPDSLPLIERLEQGGF